MADIYVENKLNTITNNVIEVQITQIGLKDIIERTKDYNDANCVVIWVTSLDRWQSSWASGILRNGGELYVFDGEGIKNKFNRYVNVIYGHNVLPLGDINMAKKPEQLCLF